MGDENLKRVERDLAVVPSTALQLISDLFQQSGNKRVEEVYHDGKMNRYMNKSCLGEQQKHCNKWK